MARGTVSIVGIENLRRGLTQLQQEQYPFAMMRALNAVAAKVKEGVVERMDIDLDRPTPFTKNAMRIDYATRSDLTAAVRFKDPDRLSPSQHYLYPSAYGVKRGFKKFEAALHAKGLLPARMYAVPGRDQPLDAYGNVSAGLMREILAWFAANPERAGYQNNMTDATRQRRRRGTRNRFGYEFFVLKRRTGNRLPGIYRRVFLPYQPGQPTSRVYSVFIFVPASSVWYPAQYKFDATARQIFNANLRPVFGEEMRRAVETAFRR